MNQHLEALKDAKLMPLWHDSEMRPELLPALSGNESCDLLIVGGGFTGLWAAIQLKERQPDADIVLIEKTFIADGASGRNGGFLSTSIAHGESNVEARFADETEQLEAAGEQNIRELLETLQRYNIDARYEKVGETEVALDDEAAGRLHEEYLELKDDGEDVVWFDKQAIRNNVKTESFFAACWHRGGQDGVVDPARVCWGLRDVLLNRFGVRIYEGTEMTSVKPLGKDKMLAVCTAGEIQSNKVLVATNAYTSPLGKVNRCVIPIWDYQLATEPLTDEQIEKIGWGLPESRHALADYNNMFHYFRLTKDKRITWGGGGAVRYYFNRGIDPKYMDAPARHEQLAREFFDMFPQLEGEIKFSHKWGGIIATSTRFCMVPGVAYNGRLAWSVGYTGHGVSASRFGARVALELLGYQPSDIIRLKFITRKAIPWAPEPIRWLGVRITQLELERADRNGGKRGLWLKLLDSLGLGFAC